MPLKQSNTIGKIRGDKGVNWNQSVFASLVPVVAGTNTIDLTSDSRGPGPGRFLLNPSSWEEGKSANWASSSVPGQSDPVLQWISSGARVVSFEALVTKEFADFGVTSNIASPPSTTTTLIGELASQFFGITLPTKRQFNDVSEESPQDLDISGYLDYYRSLLYPVYNENKLQYSPPLVVLYVGNTFNNKPNGSTISTNSEVWVVTNLKIRITKQLQNLTPMEALVEFQLMQYNIKSSGRDRFFWGPHSTGEFNQGTGI